MAENFNSQPTLEDALVILRPLREGDLESLFAVASDPSIWEQHPAKERSQREGFTRFFDEAIQTKSALLILEKQNNEVIGTSRYNFSKESSKAIEIGWTFLAKKYWGGRYNNAIKQLMMAHAFAHFDYVLFYIDVNNFRSQRAVEKLGGKRIIQIEGTTLEIRPGAALAFAIERSVYYGGNAH